MLAWQLVDRAPIPGGSGELHLYKRGGEFSIRRGSRELMNSRTHGSEDALAELTCARIAGCRRPRLLIGGLGMGYTLGAALARLPSDARIVVAELVPGVVAWNRGVLGALAAHPLGDPRVTVREVDVGRILQAPGVYDAIVLDLDNGPEALTHPDNERIYSAAGLTAAHARLNPGGVLAIWSAAPSRPFHHRLQRVGFAVEELKVSARGRQGGRAHTIWIAQVQRDGRAVKKIPRRPT